MREMQKRSGLPGIATLLVFAVFAVCILFVLLSGASIYRDVTQSGQLSFEQRTVEQYLTTRVRQSDSAGCITVEEFEGISALVLREHIDGEVYETRIYCCDGYLWELFSGADSGLLPEDGEKLLQVQALQFACRGDVLTAELVTADGQRQRLIWYLRSGEEASV